MASFFHTTFAYQCNHFMELNDVISEHLKIAQMICKTKNREHFWKIFQLRRAQIIQIWKYI